MSALTPILMVALTASNAVSALVMPMRSSAAPICSESRQLLSEARQAYRAGLDQSGASLVRAVLLDRGLRLAAVDRDAAIPLRKAVDRWNSALGERIFTVSRPQEADILVKDVPLLSGEEQGRVETQTATGREGAYEVAGEIEVCDNTDGVKLRTEQIAEVITHELGHVLGLDDDPSDSGIMGAFDPARVVSSPSSAEVAAVQTFRAEARGLLHDASRE